MTANLRWAIDANIIVQQATGRLISGCIEATHGHLLVPERALMLARAKYRDIARRRARRVMQFDPDLDPKSFRREERREIAIQCALAIQTSFSDWAAEEPTRNDGLWTVAPHTTVSSAIAMSLHEAGIAGPGETSRIEEDAEVAAQALAAGCRWIASNNLGILVPGKLERWIAHEQRHGRLDQADTSFICSTDTAIEHMFGGPSDDTATTDIAAIAWELNRPNDEDAAKDLPERLRNAVRFVNALHSSGATDTADRLSIYFNRQANPADLHQELTGRPYAGTLQRTRAGYDRLAVATRNAQETALEPHRQDWSNAPNEWDRS